MHAGPENLAACQISRELDLKYMYVNYVDKILIVYLKIAMKNLFLPLRWRYVTTPKIKILAL